MKPKHILIAGAGALWMIKESVDEDLIKLALGTVSHSALAIGTVMIIGGMAFYPFSWVMRYIRKARAENAEIQIKVAEACTKMAEAEAIHMKARHTATSGKNVVVVDQLTGNAKQFAEVPKQLLLQQQEQALLEQPQEQEDAIIQYSYIHKTTMGRQDAPCLIAAGKKRSGKTTLIENLTHIYTDVYWDIIDPKIANNKLIWGPTARVVHTGDNWSNLRRYTEWVLNVDQVYRAKHIDEVENMMKRLIVLDEPLDALNAPKPFGEYFQGWFEKVLTKLSYLGIGIFVLPQACTATALKFDKGTAQLMDCFDGKFWFKHNKKTDERRCFFEVDGEMEQIPLYTPLTKAEKLRSLQTFGGGAVVNDVTITGHRNATTSGVNRGTTGTTPTTGTTKKMIYLPPPSPVRHQSIEHQIIYESFKAGESLYSICKKTAGKDKKEYKPNSRDYAYARSVLALYDIEA